MKQPDLARDLMHHGLSVQHTEYPEDFKAYRHPGYWARICEKCGEGFIQGFNSHEQECARPECGKPPLEGYEYA